MMPLSRRRFLQASLAAAAVGMGIKTAAAAPATAPNILFIALDDLNDWVNCLGGYPGTVHTPNIDALAASGTLFTNAHCAIPLCNASRTSTLTGLSPLQTQVFYNTTRWHNVPTMKNAVPIPKLFRHHGYRTIGAGKIFHFQDTSSWDDYWPDTLSGEVAEPIAPDVEHPLRGGTPLYKLDTTFDWGVVDTPVEKTPDYQTSDWIIRQLKTPATQPLFIGYGIGKPHLPWYLPKAYFDRYPLHSVQLPAVLQGDLDDVPAAGRELINEYLHKHVIRNDFWKKAVQAYLASITFADEQLGRVMRALAASPLAHNTLIVLWSDHGWHLGEKLQWRKLTLWQEATHVPLIFSGPGVQAGQRCHAPVSLLDLYPTLTSLAKLPMPYATAGHNLAPLLQQATAPWPHKAFTVWQMHGTQNHVAVVDERYRLIRYADGSKELYDHDRDPHEWHNLAGQDAYQTIEKSLAAAIDDYIRNTSQPV